MNDSTESGTMDYPKKLFYRINEVAKITGVETYVLRYWETKFPMLAPEKDSSDQRRYRQTDIELVFRIKQLLYEDKFTIAGAVEKLQSDSSPKKKGGRKGRGAEPPPEPEPQTETEIEVEADEEDETQAEAEEPDVMLVVEDSEDEPSEAAPAPRESRPRKSATSAAIAVAPSAAPPPQWEVMLSRAAKARKELHDVIAEIKEWRGQAQ